MDSVVYSTAGNYSSFRVSLVQSQVVFSVGYGPRYQAIFFYLMTNSRISIGKMTP